MPTIQIEPTHEPRGIHRRIEFVATESLRYRFAAKVDYRNEDECWNWIGAQRNGYGAIKHNGQVLGTHVVAYVIEHEQVPEGMIVLHTCDNRLCCNPKHLEAGTFGENVRQMFDRRSVNRTFGEKSPGAILDSNIVNLARSLSMVKGWGVVRIGRVLKFNENTLKGALYSQTWKHLAWPTQEEAQRIVEEFSKSTFGEIAMASVVKEFPQDVKRRWHGYYDKFLDGQIWKLTLGEDCPASASSAQSSLRNAADRKGVSKVAIRVSRDEGCIYVQAILDKKAG